MLTRSPSETLTDQLANRFAQRIRNRLLPPGSRLPSVRECAQRHEVSPYTVVAAYDQLLAQGLIEARRNRGFFVRESRADTRTEPAGAERGTRASPQVRAQPPVDAATLIRGMFRQVDSQGVQMKGTPGMGVLPAEWLETTMLGSAVRRVSNATNLRTLSLQYGEPAGDPALRRALSHKLAGMEIEAPPEQIVTAVGATHALDIICRTLLKAGDSVMVDEPGWAVEFARLTQMGMRILPVPRHEDGPDLAVMARYCEAHAPEQRPKLFISVSVLHNPTGLCLTPSHAHRVLQLAQQHDFLVVEDDTYSHLAPPHATRMCALDALRRSIYVSGFAKILAPNWRVGYLAAPPALVERFIDTKLLTTLTTPSLFEQAIAHCLEQGQIRRHADRVRARLDAARSRSVQLALKAGCRFVTEPAGLFGWVDTGVDTDRLAQAMLDEGYLLAPGSLFHAVRQSSTLMRLNFANTQDSSFWSDFVRIRGRL
ncbi:PLP-dependent aminotransferase family protein [Aquabacterium sp. A7-Y]|uniref:aminotransferase-like domain-containing protein n=1 Tax=Aquabacterium sp. A7-Y TaxID=1349605 RepID=UPI00223CC77B|nr:PLP-dependent aminotransferase family protein [Aquabacterium sp. A7-Y]MCW7539565.1 PLP-dependent aminotransferase family protein [Aquabacterium sp. A7-Y]